MPYRLKVEKSFSAAHQILEQGGKCERMHGHNFQVTVLVEGHEPDPATGMLLDFGVLKAELSAVLDELDHSHLNQLPAFEGRSVSSERIARHIHDRLAERLADHAGVRIAEVEVGEKPGQSAAYIPEAG
ncbi:6-pyruvoyl trahydropterin synthase family protein [Desulfohalovibrio reitneri]|jgi:6-pyruvoyltetrahydropterin/6-carboxytetrahydropterin synthase|uniref:6-pyruvoyl trahydropterin synthase family protein n=1 Tax=Desulfohalovibrio reitneri TaxID=1307759 RepID=UPI0004A6E356|nr:6-carboxytetrahydropterin synthase [Desulfohalovibrio reitneri]